MEILILFKACSDWPLLMSVNFLTVVGAICESHIHCADDNPINAGFVKKEVSWLTTK